MRFLTGFIVGVVVCIAAAVVMMLFFTPSATKSMALDDLANYREVALKASVMEAEKQAAVASLDRMIERVHARGIDFWEFAMATGDIDPLVQDEVVTEDEWPRFAAEVRAAEIILVGSGPPRPGDGKGTAEAPPGNR